MPSKVQHPVQTQKIKSIMRKIIILALLLSKGFTLDERNQAKVTVHGKQIRKYDQADVHLHKLEKRAISNSKLMNSIQCTPSLAQCYNMPLL